MKKAELSDVTGFRGEKIVELCLTDYQAFSEPLFRPGFRMSEAKSRSLYVERRGELLAELFLQDLNPEFVARATGDVGYDFLVGFRNSRGGVNNISGVVKTTERLVQNRTSRSW